MEKRIFRIKEVDGCTDFQHVAWEIKEKVILILLFVILLTNYLSVTASAEKSITVNLVNHYGSGAKYEYNLFLSLLTPLPKYTQHLKEKQEKKKGKEKRRCRGVFYFTAKVINHSTMRGTGTKSSCLLQSN
mgnify:CR=1 FL=1